MSVVRTLVKRRRDGRVTVVVLRRDDDDSEHVLMVDGSWSKTTGPEALVLTGWMVHTPEVRDE